MKKVAVFLANGFEEIEALTVVDYMRRGSLDVKTVSVTGVKNVEGAHKITVESDLLLEDLAYDEFQGFVIPGGIPGATNLRDDQRVIEIIKKANKDKKLIAAICAGPIVLEKADVIKGKNATSFPGFDDQMQSCNYVNDKKVVVCDNIITSRGPSLAVYFALEIINYIAGEKIKKQVSEGILLDIMEM